MKKNIIVLSLEYPKPSLPFQGVFTAQFTKALAKKSQVTIICPTPWFPKSKILLRFFPEKNPWTSIPKSYADDNIKIHYLPFFTVPFVFRYLNALSIALACRKTIKDIHNTKAIDVLHAYGVYPDGVAAALLSKWLKIPNVITALGSDVNKEMQVSLKQKQSLWALNRAAAVIGVSKDLVKTLIYYGVDKKKVHWVPTGVCRTTFKAQPASCDSDTIREQLRSSLALDASKKIVLFVGRLHPVKGLDSLLEAASILQQDNHLNFVIVLIGEGPLLQSLSNSAVALGISDSVIFIGPQPQTIVAQWMQAANLLCLPSHMEGLPNVILESLAQSLPVVASNVGGIPEVITHDKNGLLVPADKADKLAEALVCCLAKAWDKKQLAQSVEFAQWESIIDTHLTIYADSTK
jgi:teichuronic acid biosynthesis glycosyltransferase TuaC